MSKKLKKVYLTLLLPSILLSTMAVGAKAYDLIDMGSANFIDIAGPLIFILCIVFAMAFPIFHRTLFAYKNRDVISVSEEKFFKFERTLIYVVMITPYLALTAYLLEMPRFYTAGGILMGLYAVYYFYPSEARIGFDKRIFRAVSKN